MKRTAKNHKPRKRFSGEDHDNHRRFTKDEKMASKYGPVSLMMEEDFEEEEESGLDR